MYSQNSIAGKSDIYKDLYIEIKRIRSKNLQKNGIIRNSP